MKKLLVLLVLFLFPVVMALEQDGRYCMSNNLCFLPDENGYIQVFYNDRPLRKIGFAITSDEINRTSADFTWDIDYHAENETYEAEASNPHFLWNMRIDFSGIKPKIRHYVVNDYQDLHSTKMWYIATINENDYVVYNDKSYPLNQDYHIRGDLNNRMPQLHFPLDGGVYDDSDFGTYVFDYSDLLSEFDITDFFVGDASMFGYPALRILAIGFSKGAGTFSLGSSVTVDPTVTNLTGCTDNPTNFTCTGTVTGTYVNTTKDVYFYGVTWATSGAGPRQINTTGFLYIYNSSFKHDASSGPDSVRFNIGGNSTYILNTSINIGGQGAAAGVASGNVDLYIYGQNLTYINYSYFRVGAGGAGDTGSGCSITAGSANIHVYTPQLTWIETASQALGGDPAHSYGNGGTGRHHFERYLTFIPYEDSYADFFGEVNGNEITSYSGNEVGGCNNAPSDIEIYGYNNLSVNYTDFRWQGDGYQRLEYYSNGNVRFYEPTEFLINNLDPTMKNVTLNNTDSEMWILNTSYGPDTDKIHVAAYLNPLMKVCVRYPGDDSTYFQINTPYVPFLENDCDLNFSVSNASITVGSTSFTGYCHPVSLYGDELTVNYNWYRNDVLYNSGTEYGVTPNNTTQISTLPKALFNVNDSFIFECQAQLDSDYSSFVNSSGANLSSYGVGNCTDYAYPILNISYWDELSDESIQIDNAYDLQISDGVFSYNVTGIWDDTYNNSICSSANPSEVDVDYQLTGRFVLTKDGYATNTYQWEEGDPLLVSNDPTLLRRLYMINLSESTTITYNWYTTEYQAIDGTLYIYRCLGNGTRILVSSPPIINSIAVGNIELINTQYSYEVVTGGVLYRDEESWTQCHVESSDSVTYYIDTSQLDFDALIGFQQIQCNLTKPTDSTARMVWGSNPYSDAPITGCLTAYRQTIGNYTQIWQNCSTFPLIQASVPDSGWSYLLSGKIYQGGYSRTCEDSLSYYVEKQGADVLGSAALFGIVLLVMAMMLMYAGNNEVTLIMGGIGVVIAFVIGITAFDWKIVSAIIALIVIVIAVARGSRK